jgi:hypothetical protein
MANIQFVKNYLLENQRIERNYIFHIVNSKYNCIFVPYLNTNIMTNLITTKDYSFKNAPIVWAVISNENVIIESNFYTKKDAEHFRDFAYCGYYKDCIVKIITKRINKIKVN